MTGRDTIGVGTRLPSLVLPRISRSTLALFAAASGDHNPIHIDLDSAREAQLGDVIAPGMLSMAYLGRLLTEWLPQDHIRSFHVRFVAVTPVHAEPACRGEVSAIDVVDGERHATVVLSVTLPDGTTTLSGEAVVALGKD